MPAGRDLAVHCAPLKDMPRLQGGGPAATGAVQLWYAPVGPLGPHMDALHALLDREERQRADRFRFHADRNRFIAGHGLLRILLGAVTRTPATDVRMERGQHGKPFLPEGGAHFNLSDTKDAVLIGIGGDCELGVDIETMHRPTDHELVAERYFTPEEVHYIQAGAADAKRRFLTLWTRKEAVLKASGVGIMDDLHALRVLDGEHLLRIRQPDFVRAAAAAYHVSSYSVGDAHLVALATPTPHRSPLLLDALELLPEHLPR